MPHNHKRTPEKQQDRTVKRLCISGASLMREALGMEHETRVAQPFPVPHPDAVRALLQVNEERRKASAQGSAARSGKDEVLAKRKAFVGTVTECDGDGMGRLVYCGTDGARYIIRFLRASVMFKVGDLVWFDVKPQAEDDGRNPLAVNVTRYMCSHFHVES